MNTKTHLTTFIHTLPIKQPHVVVALSGGPDSMFLLHMLFLLAKEGLITLSAAHLDHGWRKESDKEALFCQKMCLKLSIPFYAGHAQEFEHLAKKNGSLEDFGRQIRRQFFSNIMHKLNADYIALGHHEQDQHETFLFRLMRGATLQGLTGMKMIDGVFIRPLLTTAKDDIVAYLKQHSIPYLTDPSNASDDFLRNRIRNHVIPALRRADKRFDKKCSDTINNLTHEEAYLSSMCHEAYQQIFTHEKSDSKGILSRFLDNHRVIQKRVLIKWLSTTGKSFAPSNGFLEEILRFLESSRGGKHHIGPGLVLCKKAGTMWLETKNL